MVGLTRLDWRLGVIGSDMFLAVDPFADQADLLYGREAHIPHHWQSTPRAFQHQPEFLASRGRSLLAHPDPTENFGWPERQFPVC